jgi:Fe-S-cluster containining protein
MSREKITSETCRSCGLCCLAPHAQDAFCDVTAADVRRLGRWGNRNVLRPSIFAKLAAAIDGEQLPFGVIVTKSIEPTRGPLEGCPLQPCVALRGTPGVKVSCSVYDRRPEACRSAVEPGDGTCRALRDLNLRG